MAPENQILPGGHRLLCVFAHPDDESYGPGGTIARAALDGVGVFILMFTCGEAGSIGVSKKLATNELCRRRTLEFEKACSALGVTDHRLLGVPDKGVSACDREWAVQQVTDAFRIHRPHVALSFHHDGVSGHPDHVAVTSILVDAFDRAAREEYGPLKLYEWGIPAERARLYDRPSLRVTPATELHACVSPGAEAMDCKMAAIACHATQIEFLEGMQEKFDYRKESEPEWFTRRRCRVDAREGLESSLFHGLPPVDAPGTDEGESGAGATGAKF